MCKENILDTINQNDCKSLLKPTCCLYLEEARAQNNANHFDENYRHIMIATIVCCICVMCTAVLATYGMSSSSSFQIPNNNNPDLSDASSSRSSTGPLLCIPFFVAFTSCCILVSTAYYLTIKLSILAMGTLMTSSKTTISTTTASSMGRRRRGITDDEEDYYDDDDENDGQFSDDDNQLAESSSPSSPSSSSSSSSSSSCHSEKPEGTEVTENERESPWSFSEEEKNDDDHANNQKSEKAVEEDFDIEMQAVAEKTQQKQNTRLDERGGPGESSSLSSLSMSSPPPTLPKKQQPAEKYTSIKVWTNVYGLALGMFCIVYSLLLPNELSSFTFCMCLWIAGTYECISKSGNNSWLRTCCLRETKKRPGCSKKRRGRFCIQSLTAICKAICSCSFFYSDEGRMRRMSRKKRIFMELQELHRRQRPFSSHSNTEDEQQVKRPSSTRAFQQPKIQNSWAICCLCLLLMVGMMLKAMGSLISGRIWEGIISTEGPEQQEIHAASMLCSVLVPVMGVAAIKNMQSTKDIRSTMELSVPACSMGSLVCLLLCIVLTMTSNREDDCITAYLWEIASRETR